MKLPNGEQAIIDEEKILNYLLDPLHREGRHHAELFRRLLGIVEIRGENFTKHCAWRLEKAKQKPAARRNLV